MPETKTCYFVGFFRTFGVKSRESYLFLSKRLELNYRAAVPITPMQMEINRQCEANGTEREQIITESGLQQFVNEIDFDNVAEFFKKFIESQINEDIVQDIDRNVEQKIGWDKSIDGHEDEETPKFGTQHKVQMSFEDHNEADEEINNKLTEKHPQKSRQSQQFQAMTSENNQRFINLDFSQQALPLILDIVDIYSQNALQVHVNYERIENLPLYGIDHSKQFFQAHPSLSQRYKVQQSLARYICNTGIEAKHFEQGLYLNEELSLSGIHLEETAMILILTTFRKIEQFLQVGCKKRIVRIQLEDIRSLYPILLNAKATLSENNYQTFIRMVRLAFDLPTKASEKEVEVLYAVLLDIIRSKKVLYRAGQGLNYGIQENIVWDQQNIRKLCELYLEKESVQGTLEPFNSFFGYKANICTLRLKIQSLIHGILSKLQGQLVKYDQARQYLIYLNSRNYRLISRDPKALSLRKILFKIYLKGDIFLQDARNAFKELQKVLHHKHSQYEKPQRSMGEEFNFMTRKKTSQKISEEERSVTEESDSSHPSNESEYKSSRKAMRRSNNDSSHSKRQLTLQQTYNRSSQRHSQHRNSSGTISSQFLKKRPSTKTEVLNRRVAVKQQYNTRYK